MKHSAEQQDKWTVTLSSNMNQYKEKVQNLVSNKLQELLHYVTAKWK